MEAGGRRIEKKKTVKRQIRDTMRLLLQEDLPETVRLTKERVLKSLQQELTDKQVQKISRKVAKKYRMVKFFEKRKITRKLKSKLKEYSASTDTQERSKLLAELYSIRRELNYVINYPEGEKYLALYPSTETTSAKANSRKKNLLEEIMSRVERGELPDAAETEAQWSSIMATGDSSSHHARGLSHHEDTSHAMDDCDQSDSDADESGEVYLIDTEQRTKDCASKTKSRTQHKTRQLRAPACEEANLKSESEMIMQTRDRLKEDDFFLMS